jgi:hypothetical protein
MSSAARRCYQVREAGFATPSLTGLFTPDWLKALYARCLILLLGSSRAHPLTKFLFCSHIPFVAEDDLPYRVELWDEADSRVEELVALCGDYGVARAAFEEAMRRRPGRIVTLRQKTRVLADSRRKA